MMGLQRPTRGLNRTAPLPRRRAVRPKALAAIADKTGMTMKVFFLGAGASRAAGYPLAKDLFSSLERECVSTPDSSVVAAWECFRQFTAKEKGTAGLILQSGNPEIALSLLDLLCAAREFDEGDYFGSLGSEQIQEHPFLTRDKTDFIEARKAIKALLHCLRHYFGWQHFLDSQSSDKRHYLKRELSPLASGDIVITTNWDSLSERVLLEEGLWSPFDGFGFPISFRSTRADPAPAVTECQSISPVRVLKLHGSFGWWTHRGSIYLRSASYLQHMPPPLSFMQDLEEPTLPEIYDDPVLIYPTFLKRFDSPDLSAIWSAAQEALLTAAEVHVAGYSLPASDTPVRTLFNSLRGRLERGEVLVLVDEPSSEAGKRWRDFLPGVEVRERKWE